MGLLTPIIAFIAVALCAWLVVCYAMLTRARSSRSSNFLLASVCCWGAVAYVLFAREGFVSTVLGFGSVVFVAYWGWKSPRLRIGSLRSDDVMTVWSWFLGGAIVLKLIMGDSV